MKAKPVIIDTDTGVDDALALILALNAPELDIQAITTVAGNVSVDKCTRNVAYLLHKLRPDSASAWPLLAMGASAPLSRELITAPEVHGHDGLGGTVPENFTPKPCPSNAVQVILDHCQRFAGELTIIAIGPLTNLALAWQKDPDTFRKVGQIVSMGGAFRTPGNTGPVAEFNYYVDPEAAHMILNSKLPITVVPLDVTEQLRYTRKDLIDSAVKSRSASKDVIANATENNMSAWIPDHEYYADFVVNFTEHYMRFHKVNLDFYGGYLHDPIAVGWVIAPHLFASRKLHVDVETAGLYTRGMSVADLRLLPYPNQPLIDLLYQFDQNGFMELFNQRVWK